MATSGAMFARAVVMDARNKCGHDRTWVHANRINPQRGLKLPVHFACRDYPCGVTTLRERARSRPSWCSRKMMNRPAAITMATPASITGVGTSSKRK